MTSREPTFFQFPRARTIITYHYVSEPAYGDWLKITGGYLRQIVTECNPRNIFIYHWTHTRHDVVFVRYEPDARAFQISPIDLHDNFLDYCTRCGVKEEPVVIDWARDGF